MERSGSVQIIMDPDPKGTKTYIFCVPDICEEGLLNRQLRPVRADCPPGSSCRRRREQRSRGNCYKKKICCPFFSFSF
jgi:hypothetical protein